MKYLLSSFLVLVLFGAGCKTNSSQQSAVQPTAHEPQELSKGVTVDLSYQSLRVIPSSVFAQTAIETLDLSHNQLTGAPQAEIRHLQQLRSLNLSNNALTGLPAELGQLTQLTYLDVSQNKLTGLPMELGNLTQLEVLDISGNPFSVQDLDQIATKLPKTIIRR